jgi:hypothetical protein
VEGEGKLTHVHISSDAPYDATEPFGDGFALSGNPHEGDFGFVRMHFEDFAGHALQLALDLVRGQNAGLAHAGSKMAMVST